MELGFIKARQREGIERAKSQGDVYRGRKPTIDLSSVRDLFDQGVAPAKSPGGSRLTVPLFTGFWDSSDLLELLEIDSKAKRSAAACRRTEVNRTCRLAPALLSCAKTRRRPKSGSGYWLHQS